MEKVTDPELIKSLNAEALGYTPVTDEELTKSLTQEALEAARPSSGLESFVRGGIQGATGGFSDEVKGAVSAMVQDPELTVAASFLTGGNPIPLVVQAIKEGKDGLSKLITNYREARDTERAKNLNAQAENPKTYFGGELAGGIVPALAMPESKLASLVKNPVGKASLAGLEAGAELGAASGLGTSEADLTKGEIRPATGDIVSGATVGAATGAILGPVVHGISKLLPHQVEPTTPTGGTPPGAPPSDGSINPSKIPPSTDVVPEASSTEAIPKVVPEPLTTPQPEVTESETLNKGPFTWDKIKMKAKALETALTSDLQNWLSGNPTKGETKNLSAGIGVRYLGTLPDGKPQFKLEGGVDNLGPVGMWDDLKRTGKFISGMEPLTRVIKTLSQSIAGREAADIEAGLTPKGSSLSKLFDSFQKWFIKTKPPVEKGATPNSFDVGNGVKIEYIGDMETDMEGLNKIPQFNIVAGSQEDLPPGWTNHGTFSTLGEMKRFLDDYARMLTEGKKPPMASEPFRPSQEQIDKWKKAFPMEEPPVESPTSEESIPQGLGPDALSEWMSKEGAPTNPSMLGKIKEWFAAHRVDKGGNKVPPGTPPPTTEGSATNIPSFGKEAPPKEYDPGWLLKHLAPNETGIPEEVLKYHGQHPELLDVSKEAKVLSKDMAGLPIEDKNFNVEQFTKAYNDARERLLKQPDYGVQLVSALFKHNPDGSVALNSSDSEAVAMAKAYGDILSKGVGDTTARKVWQSLLGAGKGWIADLVLPGSVVYEVAGALRGAAMESPLAQRTLSIAGQSSLAQGLLKGGKNIPGAGDIVTASKNAFIKGTETTAALNHWGPEIKNWIEKTGTNMSDPQKEFVAQQLGKPIDKEEEDNVR